MASNVSSMSWRWLDFGGCVNTECYLKGYSDWWSSEGGVTWSSQSDDSGWIVMYWWVTSEGWWGTRWRRSFRAKALIYSAPSVPVVLFWTILQARVYWTDTNSLFHHSIWLKLIDKRRLISLNQCLCLCETERNFSENIDVYICDRSGESYQTVSWVINSPPL